MPSFRQLLTLPNDIAVALGRKIEPEHSPIPDPYKFAPVVGGREHLWANGKGQMAYTPPEPPKESAAPHTKTAPATSQYMRLLEYLRQAYGLSIGEVGEMLEQYACDPQWTIHVPGDPMPTVEMVELVLMRTAGGVVETKQWAPDYADKKAIAREIAERNGRRFTAYDHTLPYRVIFYRKREQDKPAQPTSDAERLLDYLQSAYKLNRREAWDMIKKYTCNPQWTVHVPGDPQPADCDSVAVVLLDPNKKSTWETYQQPNTKFMGIRWTAYNPTNKSDGWHRILFYKKANAGTTTAAPNEAIAAPTKAWDDEHRQKALKRLYDLLLNECKVPADKAMELLGRYQADTSWNVHVPGDPMPASIAPGTHIQIVRWGDRNNGDFGDAAVRTNIATSNSNCWKHPEPYDGFYRVLYWKLQ